jgi:hypothetical protein
LKVSEHFEIDELAVNLKSMNSHVQRQSLENPIANQSKPRIKTQNQNQNQREQGKNHLRRKREEAEQPFLFPETRHLFSY